MPGRKDKKKDKGAEKKAERKRAGGGGGAGDLASFLGLSGMPPGFGGEDDAELEAELMALEGKSPGKQTKKKGGGMDLDSLIAGANKIGEGVEDDDEEDSSDIDDDELLGELQELTGGVEEEEEPPVKATPPASSASKRSPHPPPTSSSKDLSVIMERLKMYEIATATAKEKGEGTKARRYQRAIGSINTMAKQAKAGKPVDMEELPPVISVGQKEVKPHPQPHPQPQAAQGGGDEFELSEEDLAAWAGSLVDDRQKKQESTPPKPQTRPKPVKQDESLKLPPPPQPKPRSALHPPASSSSSSSKPPPPSGLIDLDDPAFDEFNLTDKELTAFASKMVDDRETTTPQASLVKTQSIPPHPSPRAKLAPNPRVSEPPQVTPKPKPPAGLIDLDTPEFAEFSLSEADLESLAAAMVDDRAKKPKLEEPVPMDTSLSQQSVAPSRSLPAQLKPPTSDRGTLRALLVERRDQYAAVAKSQRDPTKKKEYRVMAAQFSRVVKAFDQGQEVDLSQMPGPPPGYKSSYSVDVSKFTPKQSPKPDSPTQSAQSPTASLPPQPEGEEVDPQIPIPKTTLEALEQRLAKYKEGCRTAEEKGESSRARRMKRIVKQYEEAIRANKTKKPFDYSDLPTPPGYPPIPVPKHAKPVQPAPPMPTQSLPVRAAPRPATKPLLQPSISHEQLAILEERRTELLTATKQAKAKGDKEMAVHYYKLFRGLESMLEAAKSGVPVNLEQVPPSPFADISKTKPSQGVLSHLKPAAEGDSATFDLIEGQLQKQIDICDSNAETYDKMGNTGPATQYKNMSQNCQRELLAIKGIRMQGLCPPKFTMETRKFTLVHSNTDLSSQQCEVEVVRALNIPRPQGYEEKDMNVYVEIEFPWPSEEPSKQNTGYIKGSCNPEFNSKHKFDIDRKHSRTLQRVFKRTPVKCVLLQHRTLRKELFVGQGLLSLETLETKCESRMCVDLVDEKGRKPAGGKMEAVVRLREPLSGRDQEEREEQWLVFQEPVVAKSTVSMPKPTPATKGPGASGPNLAALSPIKVENMTSMEALKLEFSLVQSAIKNGHKDVSTAQRGKQIHARLQVIKQRVQTDPQFKQGYVRQVTKEIQTERQLEQQLARAGNRQAELVILQKRRAAMEKELKTLQGKK